MKALHIALKDTLARFRDGKALMGMIAAPLLISALVGLSFGTIGGDNPISDIQVILVNHDEGELGQIYADVLASDDLSNLIDLREMDDLEAARTEVESGDAREVIFIPSGFSAALFQRLDPNASLTAPQQILVLTDPTANISPFIIQSLTEQITAGINTIILAGEISLDSAIAQAALLGPNLGQLQPILEAELDPANFNLDESLLQLEIVETGEAQASFSPFDYFVPGMAVFFLMFTMFDSSRSILQEESRGTLPRLISTPTSTSAILFGKMGGTFFTGLLQFTILVLVSALLFGINWGSSIPGLIMISVLTVFAASGLGSLVTTLASNENQAGVIGTAISMVFGALGGTFFPAQNLEGILDTVSKLTLNRWAIDGLTKLTIQQASFSELITEGLVLLFIGVATFSLATVLFRRRFVR